MRGLFGRAGFQLELRPREDRSPGAREVRLKVLACGVCGTDLHFLRQMEEFTPLGHEIAAEVVETGSGVTRVRVGDTVICEDVSMCGACDMCKSGRYDLCRNGYTLEGQPGMSDELIVHENMLNVYRDLDPVTACMTEPLAVAIRSVDLLKIYPGDSVAVFGMGAIGLFSAAYARLLGAGRIAMIASRKGALRNTVAEGIASAYGADEIAYTCEEDYRERLLEKGAFRHVVIAAPPKLAVDALSLLDYGGQALAMGVTFGGDTIAEIDVNDMVFNKKQLLTSIAEPAVKFPQSIRLIESGRIDAGRVVTHRLAIDEADKLKELYGQDSPAIKTLILP